MACRCIILGLCAETGTFIAAAASVSCEHSLEGVVLVHCQLTGSRSIAVTPPCESVTRISYSRDCHLSTSCKFAAA
ncbi:MAG: hypothetical protein MRZ57_05425, partial [Bacteroidales bacterium]|nr:hypothetical protein [Bacteroidales bacterium]